MSDLQITIDLPEELVEQALSVGLSLENPTPLFINMLSAQIEKRKAGQRLMGIAEELQSLPPELKPSEAEIQAEIQAYWDEQTDQS